VRGSAVEAGSGSVMAGGGSVVAPPHPELKFKARATHLTPLHRSALTPALPPRPPHADSWIGALSCVLRSKDATMWYKVCVCVCARVCVYVRVCAYV